MPTPLEILLDPVSLGIIAIYAMLMLVEAFFPARTLPEIRNWRVKGIFYFFVFFYLSSYLPLLYQQWLPSRALINFSELNVMAATILGVLIYELGMYGWHFSMHKSNALWRIFHQMHHSAERLDTYGAFYFSPLDMAGFTLLGTACFSFVIGLPPQAISMVLLITNFLSVFQHANIKTPAWVGFIIQRPESHAVHHARGVHAYNYSDLPLFDILFRTFRNPRGYVAETGFYEGGSSRVADMLSFKDISKESIKLKS